MELKDFWRAIYDQQFDRSKENPEYLAMLRKYDPQARWEEQYSAGEDPGKYMGGEYKYDISKFPKTKFGSLDEVVRPTGRYSNYEIFGKDIKDKLFRPDLMYEDPNYGWITPKKNLIPEKEGTDWLGILGPLAVTALTGGLAGPGAFAALSAGQQAAMAVPGLARTYGNYEKTGKFDPMSLAPLAASFLPGNIAPLARLGTSAYNTYNAFDKGNTMGALASLYGTGKSLLNITGGP